MNKRVAFASYTPASTAFDYHHEDQTHVAPLLLAHGITIETVAWDAEGVAWAEYDAVVVRSTWDYHLRYSEFVAWLERIEVAGARVYNTPSLLRWNMDKNYLAQLNAASVPLLPTAFYPKGAHANLAEVFQRYGWETAVIKPVISAGGDNTWRVARADAQSVQARLDEQMASMGVMIQQYAPQISEGEWSFLFFGGQYSHAARKYPAQGDMFVHEHRGGRTEAVQPSAEQIAQATAVVAQIRHVTGVLPLYARVDAVMDGETLVLMELELIEPYLYLGYDEPHAAQRFADALLGILV